MTKCSCKKQASFGYPNDRKATCCKKCKKDGMVNIKHKKCPCGKHPSFGFPKDKKATCCKDCKKNGMFNIITRKCSCGKIPNFGFPDDETPTCCSDCKKDDMIDIKSKKCSCGEKRPTFGFPDDETPTCCSDCKKDDMINIISRKCSCGEKQPTFGFPDDEKATCCIGCKKDGMIDIKHSLCKANEQKIPCPQRGNPKYDNYCTHCFSHLFPSDPRTQQIRKKSKELQVVSYIANKYEEFYHDKPLYVNLSGGCCPTRKRIDLRKLINNTLLCIEIDEKQRPYHLKEDRYNDLYMDFSGKYIFIRYNPDPYKDNKRKEQDPDFETRMERLEGEIEKQIERIEKGENKELLEIIYLFWNKY